LLETESASLSSIANTLADRVRISPAYNIIHSAKVASYFRRSKEFGIADQGYTIDMSGVRDRKRKMVQTILIADLDALCRPDRPPRTRA